MPRKLRALIRDLEQAGFSDPGGRGSHRNFVDPKVAKPVTLSGQPGDDARQYQERAVAVGDRGVAAMSKADKYVKLIEWSDEDACFLGSCPELFYGGCHGTDAKEVFAELCSLVEDAVQLYEREGRPLPGPMSGRQFVNALQRSA